MLIWLNENHPSIGCTNLAMVHAFNGGHFETMKWLRENRTEISSLKRLQFINLQHGKPEVVEWVKENFQIDRNEILQKDFSIIFNSGSLKEIKWFHDNNIQGVFNDRSLKHSVEGTQLQVVKWLYENRSECRCTIEIFETAIRIGHMEIIEYLLEKHPEFANELTVPDDYLQYYYSNDDDEMIEFLLDKINFPLDVLKEYQKFINSNGYSNVSTKLLDDHIRKREESI
ncbi:hypothetical protein PPL_11408 [Heterostelium album PN500]|uniref:Ankyrin repeat protein n=1 Tax=Heterostelium pallidum (strain ATCC 26659 / Pp 5 / PN500) TaxID=670386 RepID=D3BTB5_HETP5|nr:hypothetical protein PPL_11408 [Heterostelium album PN500]EFA75332.1 hypothetical protein PPL_11408 [Heterostelium album PN500]|eukprot:XP_020427466.1 hypothetical protein PPL_11408 [Heterostelium album PN500]